MTIRHVGRMDYDYMITKIIIWRDLIKNTLFAHLTREESFDVSNSVPAEADVIYIASTNTQENDEKILRNMALSEMKRPYPICIVWLESGEIWKF